MTTIALWICVCTDDWAAESAIKASNGEDLCEANHDVECVRENLSHKIQFKGKLDLWGGGGGANWTSQYEGKLTGLIGGRGKLD